MSGPIYNEPRTWTIDISRIFKRGQFEYTDIENVKNILVKGIKTYIVCTEAIKQSILVPNVFINGSNDINLILLK